MTFFSYGTEAIKVQSSHYNQTCTKDSIPMHKGSHIFLKLSDYLATHLKKKTKNHQTTKPQGYLNAISTIPGGNKSLSTTDTVRYAQLSENHLFI